MEKTSELIASAKKVVEIEANAIQNLVHQIDDTFADVCRIILACSGKVVLMGIGKSGHIAKKIASTFASTGTSAFFVHPSEAGHGDLGMIHCNDVVIVISYSGESNEILMLLPLLKRQNIPIIAMTGNKDSAMAQSADKHLNINAKKEACPHNLAPTASTTVTLVMGDALAISLLNAKGFSPDDFASTHPSGTLGRRLLTLIDDIMCKDDDLPVVDKNLPLMQALLVMTEKKLGFVIIAQDRNILGVFTDGDLRRTLQKHRQLNQLTIAQVMQTRCQTVQADKPAIIATQIMDAHKISTLPVVDKNNQLIGAINAHSLLEAKIM